VFFDGFKHLEGLAALVKQERRAGTGLSCEAFEESEALEGGHPMAHHLGIVKEAYQLFTRDLDKDITAILHGFTHKRLRERSILL
jgi:hypothetical protein